MRISNRKRIMITGGVGFLGSHLSERMLDEVNDVLCVDHRTGRRLPGRAAARQRLYGVYGTYRRTSSFNLTSALKLITK